MSVSNSGINPPDEGSEESLHAICNECPKEWHVDDLTDGLCAECRPCGECGGSGCDECIEEVPKLPRAAIEVAIDKAAEALAELRVPTTKHLIRETVATHMEPEIKKLNDVIVGLIIISTNAVAEYAIATKASLGQDEIKELKDTIVRMSVSGAYLTAEFIARLGWEVERKELRESKAQLLEAAKEIRDAFTEYSIAGCVDEAHSVAAYPALRDAILKLPETNNG